MDDLPEQGDGPERATRVSGCLFRALGRRGEPASAETPVGRVNLAARGASLHGTAHETAVGDCQSAAAHAMPGPTVEVGAFAESRSSEPRRRGAAALLRRAR